MSTRYWTALGDGGNPPEKLSDISPYSYLFVMSSLPINSAVRFNIEVSPNTSLPFMELVSPGFQQLALDDTV
jgi:hypothetical protein